MRKILLLLALLLLAFSPSLVGCTASVGIDSFKITANLKIEEYAQKPALDWVSSYLQKDKKDEPENDEASADPEPTPTE